MKNRSRLTRISDMPGRPFGSAEFWLEFGDFCRELRTSGRTYFEYEEWRVILRRAREAGLFNAQVDNIGTEREKFKCFDSPFGKAFVEIYHGLKIAKERGLTAQQFSEQWDNGVDLRRDALKRVMDAGDEARRASMKDRERESAHKRGERTRRKPADDDAPREVRVGYQPELTAT